MAERARAKTEEIQQQQEVGRGTEENVQMMSNTITELQREKVKLKEQELKEEVAFWQGQYFECQEQMEAFLNQREVVTFHDGRYTDSIIEVYMELMCMRVGAKNVPEIDHQDCYGKDDLYDPQRLPGSTFAKYMLLEARSVALVHLKEEIHSSEGKTMCMGMRDMACGDAEAYRKLLEGIINEMTGDDNDQRTRELTPVSQQLYDAFKRLSIDASTLMKVEEFIFGEETVQKDRVFDRLGGKYATGWSQELLEESASVPRTNVGPERIFSQLDSLIRVMPRATINAMEGITMSTQNHTANWLGSLDEAHRFPQSQGRLQGTTPGVCREVSRHLPATQGSTRHEEGKERGQGSTRSSKERGPYTEATGSRRQRKRSFRNLQKKKNRDVLTLQRKGRRHKMVHVVVAPFQTHQNLPIPIDEPDGSSKWYYGIVTELKVRRSKYMYTLGYDGETDTFSFPLLDDMESGELRIVPLDPAFIEGRRVDHIFCREVDWEEFWFTGTVTGHDAVTGLSTVAYDYEDDDDDDDDEDDSNVFEERILKDYQKGNVRILL
ncbi:unnamed protein product [Mytilus coruscus]|uniref:Uncharacterized protein n=1 Tax=Mytilus coruscus TaxID=42192 RepID=A0A6J8ER05_MYTCO|nr:unnamed protein product [Mytilus coruscus]